jgi:hypothetical protein
VLLGELAQGAKTKEHCPVVRLARDAEVEPAVIGTHIREV